MLCGTGLTLGWSNLSMTVKFKYDSVGNQDCAGILNTLYLNNSFVK